MKYTYLIYLVVSFFFSSFAYSTTISDGEFTAWSSFSFVTDNPFVAGPPPNVSNGNTVIVASGGNPSAFLQATHTFTTGDTIWTGGVKTDYTYDPKSEGTINTLSVAVDVRMLSTGVSAWQLVVEQGGQRYFSFPWDGFSNNDWANVSISDLVAKDFDTNPWAGRAGVLPDGLHPDFSSSGEPLQFGFMFGNRIIGSGTLTNTLGLDNFSVKIVQLSENPTDCSLKDSTTGTVSPNLDIHMPSLNYQSLDGIQNIWANFEYYGQDEKGELLWKLKEYAINQ